MQSTQSQIQNLGERVNRDRDRQLVIDKTMADIVAISAAEAPSGIAERRPGEQPAAEQLQQAREGLRALQLRLKPEHPDVIRAQRVDSRARTKGAGRGADQPGGRRDVGASGPERGGSEAIG